jgi:HSP20 family molecular chaperone IbpA
MEIAFGRFERSIRIAIPFERDGVTAHLEEGFLSVVLPKRESPRRQVEIER